MRTIIQALGMSERGLDTWTPNKVTYAAQNLPDEEITNWVCTCLAQSVLKGPPRLARNQNMSVERTDMYAPTAYTRSWQDMEACMVARSHTLVLRMEAMFKLARGDESLFSRPKEHLEKLKGQLHRVVGILHYGHNRGGHWVTVVWEFRTNQLIVFNSFPQWPIPTEISRNLCKAGNTLCDMWSGQPCMEDRSTARWKVVKPSVTVQKSSECGARSCLWLWAFSMWPDYFLDQYLNRAKDPMASIVKSPEVIANVLSLVTRQCLDPPIDGTM